MSIKNNRSLSDVKEKIDNVEMVDLILDFNVVPRSERIKQTPATDGEWMILPGVDGPRGMCGFYPSDEERKMLLASYGRTSVRYDVNGEPDFSPFATAQVRISDMQGGNAGSRQKNFGKANERLKGTKWAKERGLNTKREIEEYIKENKLTWHEKSDGVTMQLVPTDINAKFGHVGGVSTISHLKDNDGRIIGHTVGSLAVMSAQETTNLVQKTFDTVKYNAKSANDFVDSTTAKYVSNEFSKINRAGLDAATTAAVYSGALSILRNSAAVAAGNKTEDEARKEILTDTTTTAVTAYVTGALAEKLSIGNGEAGLIVAGAIQITQNITDYANRKIDEEQFVTEVAETGAYLVAAYIGSNLGKFVGKGIGAAIGQAVIPIPGVGVDIGAEVGAWIGSVVGEIITTIICYEVISTIKYSKEFEKRNSKIISLCRHAEREIRESQIRLKLIIEQENEELVRTIDAGFEKIYAGMIDNSYDSVQEGLITIGRKFGLSKAYFEKDKVDRSNLFKRQNEMLVIE